MTKARKRGKRLASLVDSLAAELSTPSTAFDVLRKCASLLGYQVQDDGRIAPAGVGNGKKRKRHSANDSNGELVDLQHPLVVETETEDVFVTNSPLVVRDARRKKQASPGIWSRPLCIWSHHSCIKNHRPGKSSNMKTI